MDIKSTGQTIAKLRKSRNMTQSELAEKLGVTDKAVSKWERGISCPDVSLLNKLSYYLDTDIESLLNGREEKHTWVGVLIPDESVSLLTFVFDKRLIDYLISQFLLVGITNIVIVSKKIDISIRGVNIDFVDSIDVVNQQFTENLFLIYGNTFLFGADITKHFRRAMSNSDSVTAICMLKGKGECPVSVDENKDAFFCEELKSNQYYAEPFIFIPYSKIIEINQDWKKTLNIGRFSAETVNRGTICFSISSGEDAMLMAEFVHLYERINGEKIGCLEEIMIRRGIEDYEDVCRDINPDLIEYLKKLE